MSRKNGNQDTFPKTEKMQRYYAERETTGPEFGEFSSVRNRYTMDSEMESE